MVGLAIHTSSPALGLAVGQGLGEFRCQTWPLGRALGSQLHPCLQGFLPPYTWADLTYVAVATGPGGFTGTRIGVVTARTLAQALELPLFGISSLAAIAQYKASPSRVPQESTVLSLDPPPADWAVELAAQRQEVFGAIYRPAPTGAIAHHPDQLHSREQWAQVISQWPHPCLHYVAKGDLAFSVEGVLALATLAWQRGERPHWATVLPFYGQHPVPGS